VREVHIRTCPLCEAMCGLEVHHRAGQVELIRPNRNDVWSKGYICPKGTALGHLYDDPDRLRVPVIRHGDQFKEASWDAAFERCEELLHGVRDRHGAEALTYYIGNPAAHNHSISRYVGHFTTLSGIEMGYSAGTVDQWPKNVAVRLMYGNSWTFPVPDIDRTDYFVVMGANPHASQGSLLASADVLGKMDAIRARGGRCVVIDPRRTGTCDHADEWVPIVPGTDAPFLLAVANVLFADEVVDVGGLAPVLNGLEQLEALVARWTPESVAATCRIPADTIRRLAHEIAAAPTAAVYGRIGLCNQEFGTVASWMVDVINILTGNLDRPGGAMFANPIAPALATLALDPPAEAEFGRWTSRVRGAPEVLGQVPVSCLSEEILTPGDGQIRGLVTICGNPAVSSPAAGPLQEALPRLECLISMDNWINATTRHAHVILPGLSPLEQPHWDEMIWSWATRSAGKYSPALFPPTDGRPEEWEILIRLGWMAGGNRHGECPVEAIDDGFLGGIAQKLGYDADHVLSHYDSGGPDRMVDFFIRTGKWGDQFGRRPDGMTLETFRHEPHGLDLGPMVPRLDEVLHTVSGKVELAPPYITADLDRVWDRLTDRGDGLTLVSRRHVRSNNSWMHNVKTLVKGKDRCTLLIHPDDAAAVGVADGARAAVTSEEGTVEVPVEVSDEMMTGVVSLPHGWGHDLDGVRLSVAREHHGVNNNLLAPGHLVDVISGNAVVNGIPVEVTPA